MKEYLISKAVRQKEDIGLDWWFCLDEDKSAQIGSMEIRGYRQVAIPHDWSVEYPFDENSDTRGSGGYVRAGTGWYRKLFTVGAGAEGKRLTLCFDGAYMLVQVWLNGEKLGNHVYGYTPFEWDITDLVKRDGCNVIDVKVDNSHQPNSRWYTGSGITRKVWLKETDACYIKETSVYCRLTELNGNRAVMTVDAMLTKPFELSETDARYRLEAELCCGEECFRAGNVCNPGLTASIQVNVENPKLWSVEEPNLYQLTIRAFSEEELVDKYTINVGIRETKFLAQEGFFLNGKRVKMNGVCVHHDGGCVGAAVPEEMWEVRLNKLKKMGCNSIRMSHNPPDPALLDLCDKMGFLVMDEAFDEWRILKSKDLGSNTHESKGYSLWFEEHHVEDLEAMLYRDRNHPSVVIWSIGNEVPDQSVAEGHLLAAKLKDICRRIDPTRPITQANDQIQAEPVSTTEEFMNVLDLVGYNYVDRWRTRAETMYDDDRRAHPEWCIIGTENRGYPCIRAEYSEKSRYPYQVVPVGAGKLLKFNMTHDYVIGDFMWTGIDYLGEAHWPNRSASSGCLDTCGFEKDGYYFYKSIWNREEPMVHGLPHWNLEQEPGTIVPVLCFTNCEYAELLLNGKSYGKKAYSYPKYGMTKQYGHFDKPEKLACTEDLFLAWDVPYEPGRIEFVGYIDDMEVCRETIVTAGKPYRFKLFRCREEENSAANGRSVVLVELAIYDKEGNFCPTADIPVTYEIRGTAFIKGLDNGRPDSHEMFTGYKQTSFHGRALCVLQSNGTRGECILKASAPGMESAEIKLSFE